MFSVLYINDEFFKKIEIHSTQIWTATKGCCDSINNKKHHYLSSVVYFTSITEFQYQILKCSIFP